MPAVALLVHYPVSWIKAIIHLEHKSICLIEYKPVDRGNIHSRVSIESVSQFSYPSAAE
jgi:hypothetical protein